MHHKTSILNIGNRYALLRCPLTISAGFLIRAFKHVSHLRICSYYQVMRASLPLRQQPGFSRPTRCYASKTNYEASARPRVAPLTETEYHMALLITFLLGLFIVLGALITVFSHDHHHVEQFSVALAFGALATLALADLLPEALEHLGESAATPVLIIICMAVGIGVLKIIDRFVPDHDSKQLTTDHTCSEDNVMHIGVMTTVAVSLHNLIEGMTVFSVAAESLPSGLIIALGVGLHNIPMGMVIFSTLQSEPRGKRIALMACACLSTFAGGLAMNCLWFAIDDFQVGLLIALTLGMIAYLVVFELLPHLMHTHNKKLAATGVIIGVAVVLVSVSLG